MYKRQVPLDLLDEVTEIAPEALAARTFTPIAAPDAAAIAEAAALLRSATDPVILAGGGSRGAGAELRALAERLGDGPAPVPYPPLTPPPIPPMPPLPPLPPPSALSAMLLSQEIQVTNPSCGSVYR